jgi:sugar (pentulose or hexulose) kinase
MNYVTGVDVGTHSTKALLVDQRGALVAQHASSYQPDTPRPLWAEQWPAVWLKAVVECVAACVGDAITAGASVTWFRAQSCHAEIEAARATPHGGWRCTNSASVFIQTCIRL